MVGETELIEGSIPSSEFDSEAEDDTDLGKTLRPKMILTWVRL